MHYHIYKNAGTSLLALFIRTFGAAAVREIDKTGDLTSADRHTMEMVERVFKKEPDLRVVSSHRMSLGASQTFLIAPTPVVLFRHPLGRLISTYQFEKRSSLHTRTESAKAARALSLNHWLEWSSQRDELTNYQLRHLGWGLESPSPDAMFPLALERLTLIDSLGVIGVVEDWANFVEKLRVVEPRIRTNEAKNIRENASPLLEDQEISPNTLERVLNANELDFRLWLEAGGKALLNEYEPSAF